MHLPQAVGRARRIVYIQFLFIFLLSLAVWMLSEEKGALAFCVGCFICFLPNLYFFWRVFSAQGARAAGRIVASFYWGEAVKFLLTAALFWCAFYFFRQKIAWLFMGYIMAQVGFWFASIGGAAIEGCENKMNLKKREA